MFLTALSTFQRRRVAINAKFLYFERFEMMSDF